MGLLDNTNVQAIIAKYKDLLAKLAGAFLDKSLVGYGVIGEAFGRLLTGMVAELVAELDGDDTTKGSDKKALVLDAAGQLFDALAVKLVGLPWWAQLAWPLVAPYVRAYAINFAGGLVEWTLEKLRGGQLAVKPV